MKLLMEVPVRRVNLKLPFNRKLRVSRVSFSKNNF